MDNIVNQATAFRDFLQGFTNAACTTTEEVPTLIFYLRKIEGAEVLLAYETNFFRQEIHKWAPIAPEPPPILEQSLSTRKPRPTKQQKMMAQLGVERPEDLPSHLRTKQMNPAKRKSMDSQPSRPPVLQPAPPAPGDSQQPGPVGDEPVLAAHPDSQNPPYPFSANYSLPAGDPAPAFTSDSSAFLPHAAVESPPLPPRSPSPHHQPLDPSLFSPPRFNRDNPEAPPGVEVDNNNPFGSSPRNNLDEVFADLTNQDVEPEPEPEPMENSHANEALEALDASNGDHHDAPRGNQDVPMSDVEPQGTMESEGTNGVVNGQAEGSDGGGSGQA